MVQLAADSLQDGQSGDGSHGVQPPSYTMCTSSFLGLKWLGMALTIHPLFSTKVKERIELYLFSMSVPSWQGVR
jgi:hypothetical protein